MFTPHFGRMGKMFSKLRPFFLEESNFVAKVRKFVGLRVKFYHFLYSSPKI